MGVMEDWIRKAGGYAGRELSDLATFNGIGDIITAPLGPGLALFGIEDDVENAISGVAQRIPVLKQLDTVANWSTTPAWERAGQTGSWKDVKAALDATGDDFASSVGYVANAIVKTPEFMIDWGKDVGISAGRVFAAMATGDPIDVGKAFFKFGKELVGPLLYIAEEPIKDLHAYQGKLGYKFAMSGNPADAGGFGFNLVAEYIAEHPEERQAIIAIHNGGYDSNNDGQVDFEGGRAVWEYIIGKQNRATRTFFEIVNDPWNALALLSLAQIGLKGAAKAMMAGSPRAYEAVMKLSQAIGVTERGLSVAVDLPLWASAKIAKFGAKKVAPELSQKVATRVAASPIGRAFGETRESIASREANEAATALERVDQSYAAQLEAVFTKHRNREKPPANHNPTPIDPTGRYEAINLEARDAKYVYIVGPDGVPVPGFDYFVGPGRNSRAKKALDALSNLFMETKQPLDVEGPNPPLMTTPATLAPKPLAPGEVRPTPFGIGIDTTKPMPGPYAAPETPPTVATPGPVDADGTPLLGPLPPDPLNPRLEARVQELEAAPGNAFSPEVPTPESGEFSLSAAKPDDWYEFKPRPDDLGDSRALTQIVREYRTAAPDRAAKLKAFFDAVGYDPETNQLTPGGLMANYEVRRRTVESNRYVQPGSGGFDRTVFEPAILAHQHFLLELVPAYERIVGEKFPATWTLSRRAATMNANAVFALGKKLYFGGFKPGNKNYYAMRGQAIRDLIDIAIYRGADPANAADVEAAAMARRMLGMFGWEGQPNFRPDQGFKHTPNAELGYSGGVTAAVWNSPGVRERESKFRPNMSPMDWIGTLRRINVRGRDSLASTPDVTDTPLSGTPVLPDGETASGTIAPGDSTSVPAFDATRNIADEIYRAFDGRVPMPTVLTMVRQMEAAERAMGLPPGTLASRVAFEKGTAPTPEALRQTANVPDEAPTNALDDVLDPAMRRQKIVESYQREQFPDNPFNAPETQAVKDDLIAAYIASDADAVAALTKTLPPRVGARLRRMMEEIQRVDTALDEPPFTIDKKTGKKKYTGAPSRATAISQERDRLRHYIPDLKSWEEVEAFVRQPVPQWAVDADRRLAVKTYPELDPDAALERLRAEGRDKFSKFDEPVRIEVTDRLGRSRPLFIPGGIDGDRFSYWELAVLEAQAFDPSLLNMRDRVKLYAKVFRSTKRDRSYDPIDVWTRLAFGVMSSNADLHDNMRMVSVMRPRDEGELREMAQFSRANRGLEKAELARKYVEKVEIPRRRAAGEDLPEEIDWFDKMGKAVIHENIGNAIDIASKIVLDMDLVKRGLLPRHFFELGPGENPANFVNRIGAAIRGLKSKTANFGMMLGDPSGWPYGTMDVWMMRWLGEWLSRDDAARLLSKAIDTDGIPLIDKVPERYRTLDGGVRMPQEAYEASKAATSVIDVDGETRPMVVGKLRNAEGKTVAGKQIKNPQTNKVERDRFGRPVYGDPRVRAVSEMGEPEELAFGSRYFPVSGLSPYKKASPQGMDFVLIDDEYKDAMRLLEVLQKFYAQQYPEIGEMSLGGFQWFIWDGIRGSFEAHFMAFPDLAMVEKLPMAEWVNLNDVYGVQKERLEDFMEVVEPVPMGGTRTAVPDKTKGPVPFAKETRIPAPSVMGGPSVQVDPAVATMRQGRLNGLIEIVQGETIRLTDTRAIIRFMDEADVSTFVHEFIHATRLSFDEVDQSTMNRFVGATGSEWTVEQEEKLARAWERWNADPRYGKSLDRDVNSVFRQMRSYMRQIYRKIKGSEIDVELTPEMEDFFGRLSTGRTRDEWDAGVRTDFRKDAVATPDAPAVTEPKIAGTRQVAGTPDPTAGTGFREPAPAPADIEPYVVEGPPAPKTRERRTPETNPQYLLSREIKDVDLNDFQTWTPRVFAGVHRVIEGESVDKLPADILDEMRKAGLVGDTNGTPRLNDNQFNAARAALNDVDEVNAYEWNAMAKLVTKKKMLGKVKLTQKKVVPQANTPTPKARTPELLAMIERGAISEADADIVMRPIPDQDGQTILDAYYEYIADGMSPRQARSKVAARIGSYTRLNDKQRMQYRRGEAVTAGRVARILGKLGTVNRIAREGQMYNIAKIVTRPLSDYIGNTAHMVITGNVGGLVNQTKRTPALVKALAQNQPGSVRDMVSAANSPILQGLDMEIPSIITNAYGEGLTKYGFAGEDLVLAKFAERHGLKFGVPTALSTLASPRVQAFGNAADVMSKLNLAEAVANDEYIKAAYRFRKEIDKAGGDGRKVIADATAAARARTGRKDVTGFSAEDVRQATKNTDYAKMWRVEEDTIRQRMADEAEKVLFAGSKSRNYEKGIGAIFYYFFWQSRSLNLAARSALNNPLVMSSYIKMWEGAQREAERNNYPETFIGTLSFWGNPENTLGWFGLTNAIGLLVPGFIMSEFYDAKKKDDEASWFEQLSTLVPVTSLFGAAMAVAGQGDETTSLLGSRQIENLALAVFDWGSANGLDLTNGQPAESVIQNIERTIYSGLNAAAQDFGADRYTPYLPSSGKKDTIKSVIWQYATEKYGSDVDSWTVEQWGEVNKAMDVIDLGSGESEMAERAYAEWANWNVLNRGLATVAPGGSILRYGPREAARTNKDEGDMDAQSQRSIITATPEARQLAVERKQVQAGATPGERAAYDYWNLIAYRVADDTETYPDDTVFPTAVGPRTAGELRAMSPEDRRTVADGVIDFAGMTDELESFRDKEDAALATGQFPTLEKYKDYQSFINRFDGEPKDFRAWARSVSPAYAEAEDRAAAWFRRENPGKDVDKYLDGWIFSARAYQAFKAKPATMYDADPQGPNLEMVSQAPGSRGGGQSTYDPRAAEAERYRSNTGGATNLLLQGAGYRPMYPTTQGRQYTDWLAQSQASTGQ